MTILKFYITCSSRALTPLILPLLLSLRFGWSCSCVVQKGISSLILVLLLDAWLLFPLLSWESGVNILGEELASWFQTLFLQTTCISIPCGVPSRCGVCPRGLPRADQVPRGSHNTRERSWWDSRVLAPLLPHTWPVGLWEVLLQMSDFKQSFLLTVLRIGY